MKFNEKTKQSFKDVTQLQSEIAKLETQKNQYEQALKEVSKLVKEFKSNKNMTMQAIVGGNLIKRIQNKECVDTLEHRKKQTEIALASIKEQIAHREDNLMENCIRLYFNLQTILPDDVIKDEDN